VGAAVRYPSPACPPLPKQSWTKAKESPPRVNYSNPAYVEVDGALGAVIHLHPQKAWQFVSGDATEHYLAGNQNREREKSKSDRDLVSRINETLAPEKHRIFES
jgi:hypothetical protein